MKENSKKNRIFRRFTIPIFFLIIMGPNIGIVISMRWYNHAVTNMQSNPKFMKEAMLSLFDERKPLVILDTKLIVEHVSYTFEPARYFSYASLVLTIFVLILYRINKKIFFIDGGLHRNEIIGGISCIIIYSILGLNFEYFVTLL